MPGSNGLPDVGRRFDYAVVACLLWSTTGLVLDVRSHAEGLDFAEEGFLTPEHVVIYSGFLAVLGLVGAATYRRRLAGADWLAAVPRGYRVGAAGLVVFALAGPMDALWHTLFGAEANVEALVSPTHLLLASGGVLFVTSPLRTAWNRRDQSGWADLAPAVVSATLAYTILTVFTLFAHPAFLGVGTTGGAGSEALGLAAVLLQSALLAGLVLALRRRFALPPGTFTLLLGANATAMAWLGQHQTLAVAGLVAGLVADLAERAMGPSPDDRTLRAFATLVPAALTAAHFGVVLATSELVWTVHLWVGAIGMAGATGLLVSYVALAPARSPRPAPARTSGPTRTEGETPDPAADD